MIVSYIDNWQALCSAFADDAMLGKIARQQNDLFRRVREGLDSELVSRGLQQLIEGRFDGISVNTLLTVNYSVRPSLVKLVVVAP